MIVSIIAAIGNDGQLGLDNKMLWHLPEEFKYFKQVTMGHCLVMGRKTFESIGRALPGRTTIVLTQSETQAEKLPLEVLVAHTPLEALALARSQRCQEVFICGGGQIYRAYLELADRLYLTRVDYDGAADTYFPFPLLSDWKLEADTGHEKNEKNPLSWRAQVYEKVK